MITFKIFFPEDSTMRIAKHITASTLIAAMLAIPGCGGSGAGQSTIGRQAINVAKESRLEGGTSYSIGPQYEDQLRQMISREVAALGVEEGKEGVPMELNRQVLLNINYFLNNARGFMTRSLSRGSKYIPMMKAIFRQKGLPEDLVYVALIESGFQTSAVSHAAAVGPWQFIAATGRRYGLTINDYVDERMDPVKSTYAAADYLTTLHDMFNSWPLAIAAYNSGEGKILRGMKNYGVSNFWDMSDVSGHLAAETRLYVPSFLAATFIAKDPGAYGLKIDVQPPDQWDEVVVPSPISFSDAAKLAGTTTERLHELNPHLKKMTTPPNETDFVLRIPAGTLDTFARAYDKGGRTTKMASASAARQHVVRKGENLDSVAAMYGLTPEALKDYNKLRGNSLRAGTRLNLPPAEMVMAGSELVDYTIKSGDTKTGIALMSGQSWADIAAMNKLDKNYRLTPGKTIRVAKAQQKKTASVVPPPSTMERAAAAQPKQSASAPSSSPRLSTITHKVQAGDTLASISRLYGVSMDTIKSGNNMKSNTVYKGQILRIKSDLPLTAAATPKTGRSTLMVVETSTPAAPATGTHTVVKGDTLMGVAQKYGMSAKELADINNIKGATINIGQKLKVRGQAAQAGGGSKAAVHTVGKGETLGTIARKYGISVKQLSELNNIKGTNIHVGQKLKLTGGETASASTSAPAAKTAAVSSTHTVKAGETLSTIAEKYGMGTRQLADLNGIKGTNIRVGQKLKVSGTAPAAEAVPVASAAPARSAEPVAAPAATGTHTVAAGETMSSIANKYNMSVKQLADLNNIKGTSIRSGQKLKVSGSPSAAPPRAVETPRAAEAPRAASAAATTGGQTAAPAAAPAAATGSHTVASGETLYSIARKYNLTTEQLSALNPSVSGTNIRAGQKLKVSGSPAPAAKPSAPATYKVSAGDTLYSIATKNNTTVETLKKLNNLKGDNVRLGQTLKLK
ncbi:hypothetical protein C4J81_05190 [Deltaproteobacteria bacterium Smac51]|nr:hypothetical protein C4J81_05190 [Deltaproteobacteria bacterium Smac51]